MSDTLTSARGPVLLDEAGARRLVESYPGPSKIAVGKDIGRLDRHLRQFIEASPFCCLSTADAAGNQDVTPRGDAPGSFKVLAEGTLAIPDRPGNNRLDSLRNILENPFVGLIFLLPGMDETVRVNGRARLSVDPELLASMAVEGKLPRCAIVIEVRQAFFHCAKAFRRSRLWDQEAQVRRDTFPTLACMIAEQLALPGTEAAAMEERNQRAYRDGLWAPLS